MRPKTSIGWALAALVVATALSGGCARNDEGGPAPVARDSADDPQGWMKDNPAAVRAFDERLRPLGLRVTRAGLTAGYGEEEYESQGSHLAVYVEPLGPATPDDYINRIPTVARVFLPSVFAEQPEIDSFDVCQEPLAPDGEVPTPVTQLLVRRENVRAVDWANADLGALVAASRATPNRIVLGVTGDAAESEAWRRAVESHDATRAT